MKRAMECGGDPTVCRYANDTTIPRLCDLCRRERLKKEHNMTRNHNTGNEPAHQPANLPF